VAFGRTLRRGGGYNRLAEPLWADPLDTGHSKSAGGRWNPPGSFGALYLNRDVAMARLQVDHKLTGLPYTVEDLDESQQHDLVEVDVSEHEWLDCVTDAGLAAVDLPVSYPRDSAGTTIGHAECQPIAQAAFDVRLPGVACRSAVDGAPPDGEELAVFDTTTGQAVTLGRRLAFRDWYWG
jgi:hypothetical protein